MKRLLALALSTLSLSALAETAIDAHKLYQQHCASCHGAQRTGGMGPALLPESLARLRPAEARKTIAEGRAATQMPAFKEQLQPADIEALSKLIYEPVRPTPSWSEVDIQASRIQHADARKLPHKPVWSADPMNLFVVVEGGDHHVSLVDGDRFEPIHRFPTRYALHGGPKFSPDGRFVFFGSRDGWISKYDLWNLKLVAEVRAGLNMRNVAVSSDGRWVIAANYLPHNIVLFDSDLKLVQSHATRAGVESSRVSAAYDAAPRQSFVVALKDLPELWEISYSGKKLAAPRRIALEEPLDDFFFDPAYRHALGASRPQGNGEARAQVVDLDAGRKVANLPIAGMPHLGSGITFDYQGRRVLASPNLKDGAIDVIDLGSWQTVKTIPTPGPGFFMRSHEKTPYAWVDSMMAPKAKDRLSIIDKRTLEVVAEVREPGKTLAHIEFTKDGRFALASVWEMDGALVVFDAATFKEVKRLPMSKPVGKYNLFNKITRSEGTSH
ncbi:mono/diheme cytochrome c family protein/DNA-binding beta-propeller fold protein YncE [Inhella inkyongensis]|uniref:Mono/diheme cytochrome c family protein/DNA-binding beta-propeller fold protein YncE n=1 Tax=Inhella inkyongensis TaxID=392593 RepID=A0A840S7E7_9BURK|nr:cytochrome D1 domain-containing protein [Inhella inkyongensis]MBB5204704.1 mono/diheme cytochrome c family protein/DNA-binding beta-propeller fold protein YncE [Inhella inkyongensis]